MLLDRLKAMTSVAVHLPSDVKSVTVIIEQKAAAAEAALKREAIALEKAITPEAEAELEKLEGLLSHIPGLSEIVAAHTSPAATPAPTPSAETTTDAVPTTPVL